MTIPIKQERIATKTIHFIKGLFERFVRETGMFSEAMPTEDDLSIGDSVGNELFCNGTGSLGDMAAMFGSSVEETGTILEAASFFSDNLDKWKFIHIAEIANEKKETVWTISETCSDSDKNRTGDKNDKENNVEKRISEIKIVEQDFLLRRLRSAYISQIQNATPEILLIINDPGKITAITENTML